jgi:DNA-binding MarR family transcriptional regulator
MQASAASAKATPAALAAELQRLWAGCMRGSASDVFTVLEELDLSLTHMKVLYLLADADRPMTVKELSERIGFSLPAASRTADALLRRDLLTREEDADDRRMKRLALTAAGADTVERLATARLAGLQDYAASLSPTHRDQLHAALRAITEDPE